MWYKDCKLLFIIIQVLFFPLATKQTNKKSKTKKINPTILKIKTLSFAQFGVMGCVFVRNDLRCFRTCHLWVEPHCANAGIEDICSHFLLLKLSFFSFLPKWHIHPSDGNRTWVNLRNSLHKKSRERNVTYDNIPNQLLHMSIAL